MITATITTNQYVIKDLHHIKTMKSIRVIIPKEWDVDYVNVILWEEDLPKVNNTDSDKVEIIIPKCSEIFLKKVIKSEQRNYTHVPARYDGQQVLIIPV